MGNNFHPQKRGALKKSAVFSDIHWGAKTNSQLHNSDCAQYIDWFTQNVKSDPETDHIVFMGDWFENRSAINIATLKSAYHGAAQLNELGMPVYFIVGNHDLYHRHTRDIHSLITYQEFDNFTIIEKPTIIEDTIHPIMLSPFLFHHEYPILKNYLHIPIWYGHFEFKGFEVTGAGMRMPTGPEAKDFIGPKYIFSGHFHKRQMHEQVIYIGNTFPSNFGDAGDEHRGMMTYDYAQEEPIFYDWSECPKYIKTKLSDLLDERVTLRDGARVKCVVDIPISFEESSYLKQKFQDDYDLREMTMEESPEITNALSETNASIDVDDLKSVNELVLQMLGDIDSEHIDNQMLLDCYQGLKT